MEIYLIRHAKTLQDSSGLLQDATAEINPKFIHQLNFAREIFKNIPIQEVICSPLKRALNSARYIFPERKLTIMPTLHEYIRPSFLDQRSREEGINFWENLYKSEKYNKDWKFEDSESFNDIVARTKSLKDYLTKAKVEKVAIVGHGTYFRHFLGLMKYSNEYSPTIFFNEIMKNFQMDNGSVYKIIFDFKQNHCRSVEKMVFSTAHSKEMKHQN